MQDLSTIRKSKWFPLVPQSSSQLWVYFVINTNSSFLLQRHGLTHNYMQLETSSWKYTADILILQCYKVHTWSKCTWPDSDIPLRRWTNKLRQLVLYSNSMWSQETTYRKKKMFHYDETGGAPLHNLATTLYKWIGCILGWRMWLFVTKWWTVEKLVMMQEWFEKFPCTKTDTVCYFKVFCPGSRTLNHHPSNFFQRFELLCLSTALFLGGKKHPSQSELCRWD